MSQVQTIRKRTRQMLWPTCRDCGTELRKLDTIKIYSGTATVTPAGEAFTVTDNKDEREDKDFKTDYFCPECGELVHLIPVDEDDGHHDGRRTTIRVTR